MSSWDAERRQQLNEDFERVFEENQRLDRDLHAEHNEQHQLLLRSIEKWENDAKTKIEKTARKAREDLSEIFNQTKTRLQQALNQIVSEPLRQALQEKDQFSEPDIDHWFAGLAMIRKELERFSSNIDFPSKHSIKLIRVKQIHPINPLINDRQFLFKAIQGQPIFYPIQSLISCSAPAIFLSERSYSAGTQFFRFRIERSNKNLFIGIISAAHQHRLQQNLRPISSIHGWWNFDRPVITDRRNPNVSTLNIFDHDEVIFILNVSARHLYFQYPSMRKLKRIEIIEDKDLCPLPWKLMIEIGAPGQCLLRLVDYGLMAETNVFS